jgi:putative SbcD/Mre11-related phosphoesterase
MFVKNVAAMKIGNYLVVSDIHIGITKELWEAGVSLPSQVKSLAKRLNKLKSITKAKYLVINGDLKHKVVGISPQERREIPEFLEMLKFSKIIIVKGNHDGNIEKLARELKKVIVKDFFVIGNYFITHGHRSIKTGKKIIVIGHNHLAIRFKDQIGATYTEPVWVRGKVEQKDARGVSHSKTIIIMPAFNELSGFFTVNKGRFQGPVASLLKNPRIYMLDGTDLGRVKDVRLKE